MTCRESPETKHEGDSPSDEATASSTRSHAITPERESSLVTTYWCEST